ncbi:hypothetical protein [Phenylobacterium sp.]|uniref:hypothetical protein n=1 Tax=Phenylobacterium sp. TaxID=1871053 RepID=UPI00356870C8
MRRRAGSIFIPVFAIPSWFTRRIARRVSPREPDVIDADDVSVLSPTGAALIGLRQGAVMPWLAGPDRLQLFRVDAVRDPPAAAARRRASRALTRRRRLDDLLSIH